MKSTNPYFDQYSQFSSRPKMAKGKRYLAIGLIALSQLALADLSYAASRVFYDGFEDGTTNKWTKDDGRDKAGTTTVQPHSGNYAVVFNWNGTVDSMITVHLPQ